MFTDFLAELIAFCTRAIFFASVFLGLFIFISWVTDTLFTKACKYLKIWPIVIEFIRDRHKYKRKLKKLEEQDK